MALANSDLPGSINYPNNISIARKAAVEWIWRDATKENLRPRGFKNMRVILGLSLVFLLLALCSCSQESTQRELEEAIHADNLDKINNILRQAPAENVKLILNEGMLLSVNINKENLVKYFIKNGADVNARDQLQRTPLLIATQKRYNDIAMFLLKQGADSNLKDNLEVPALILAVTGENIDLVKKFISNGVDINIKGYDNTTALMVAVMRKNHELVNFLIENGVDVNARKSDDGSSALLLSILEEDVNAIAILLSAGADVNLPDQKGRTALMRAVSAGNLDIINLLLNVKSINVNYKDKNGNAALSIAERYENYKDIAEILKAKGAK